jgi:hypothetical protein
MDTNIWGHNTSPSQIQDSNFVHVPGISPDSLDIVTVFNKWYGMIFPFNTMLIDPPVVITNNETTVFPVNLSAANDNVTFLVNWTSADISLDISLMTPDNNIITTGGAVELTPSTVNEPIVFTKSGNYFFYRIKNPLPASLGSSWTGTWYLNIHGVSIPSGAETATVSVFASASGSLYDTDNAEQVETGDDFAVTAGFDAPSALVKETEITAEIAVPDKSINEILSENPVTEKDLDAFIKGSEADSSFVISKDVMKNRRELTLLYLYHKNRKRELVTYKTKKIKLFDNGRSSDGVKGDGIYGFALGTARIPGVYNVKITSQLKGEKYPTRREMYKSIFVVPGFSLLNSKIKVGRFSRKKQLGIVDSLDKKGKLGKDVHQRIRFGEVVSLQITPVDKLKKKIGPFNKHLIDLRFNKGVTVSDIVDNYNGTYTVYLLLTAEEIKKEITIFKHTKRGITDMVKLYVEPPPPSCGIICRIFILLIIMIVIAILILRRKI